MILVGAKMALFYPTLPPNSNFTTISIPLSPSGWRINDYKNGAQPTATEMESVLRNLNAIYINGDWLTGVETTALDNVSVTLVPEVPTILLFLAGFGLLTGRWLVYIKKQIGQRDTALS